MSNCFALDTDLQTDIGVFHALLSEAGDGEVLAVLFKIDLTCCSGLGSAHRKMHRKNKGKIG